MHHAFCFCWPSLEMRKVKQRNIIDKYLTGPRMLITNTLIFSLLVQRIWNIPWLRLGCSYAGKIWIILTTAATGAGNWPYNLHAGKLTLPLLHSRHWLLQHEERNPMTGECSPQLASWHPPLPRVHNDPSVMLGSRVTTWHHLQYPIVQCQYRHRQTGDWALWRLERDLIKTW